MNNALFYSRALGQGPDLLSLHGFFGQGANLPTVDRALGTDFRVNCLDLPDHGHSPWLTEASLATYAAAVRDWLDQQALPTAHGLDHSLGNKVAMELALTEASQAGKLVVADMALAVHARRHQVILDTLQQVAARGCQTRAEAEELLGEVIQDPVVVGYLLMGLERGAENKLHQWCFNLAGLADCVRCPSRRCRFKATSCS